jgi:Predicted transcriptional regulators
MNNRIKKLRKNLNMTQEEFSSRIKLSRNFIAQIESGAKTPSERTIKDICRVFGISYLWLTEGIEPMYEEFDVYSMARIDDIMTGENEFAKNLFREFAKLDKSEWETLEKLIKNLAGKTE